MIEKGYFFSPCNGFHDEFHILIRFYGGYVTVFRRDQFCGVVQYFRCNRHSTNVSICENEGDPVRTLFNQTLLLRGCRGLHSSQNTVFKQCRCYRDLRVFTAGQTWTFMRTLFILDNIPFCKISIRANPV